MPLYTMNKILKESIQKNYAVGTVHGLFYGEPQNSVKCGQGSKNDCH